MTAPGQSYTEMRQIVDNKCFGIDCIKGAFVTKPSSMGLIESFLSLSLFAPQVFPSSIRTEGWVDSNLRDSARLLSKLSKLTSTFKLTFAISMCDAGLIKLYSFAVSVAALRFGNCP